MTKFHSLRAAALKSLPPGKHCDGQGLWLVKRTPKAGQWVFRYCLHGRQREAGLGSLRAVTLAEARERADAARRQVQNGEDPVKLKRQAREQTREGRFETVAVAAYEAHKGSLKRAEDGRWFSPIRVHVLPKLGKTPITEIDQHDLYHALESTWKNNHETARKALSRLKVIYEHSIALGFDVDLGVIDKTKVLLGRVHVKTTPIEALPWQDVPTFYSSLFHRTPTQMALRMLILTGVRSDAVRNMKLEQIDGDVWTIPKQHMKSRLHLARDFDVPLSDEALRLIEDAKPVMRNGFLFPNSKGGALDKMAMRNLMVERGMSARPHGFRSSFRTWLSDQTDCDRQVAEACIQHDTKSDVEAAYNRTDFLEKRRSYMKAWSDYVTSQVLQR